MLAPQSLYLWPTQRYYSDVIKYAVKHGGNILGIPK